MIILSLDLAWTGTTGWCAWDTNKDAPVEWGEFKPPYRKLPHAQRIAFVSHKIHLETLNLIRDWHPDVLVYERTDWHRSGGKREQAIERRNREALARAETVVVLVADKEGVSVMDLGANEVKQKFGAKRKDAVAHLIADEYAQFDFSPDGDDCYLTCVETGERVSHHVSDAMAVAKVAASILHQEEMIQEAS